MSTTERSSKAFSRGQRVRVKRSNGTFEDDWVVKDLFSDAEETKKVIVSKPDPEDPDSDLQKQVTLAKLREWNFYDAAHEVGESSKTTSLEKGENTEIHQELPLEYLWLSKERVQISPERIREAVEELKSGQPHNGLEIATDALWDGGNIQGVSLPNRKGKENEDSFQIFTDRRKQRFFGAIVADGVGGEYGGAIASDIVVEEIEDAITDWKDVEGDITLEKIFRAIADAFSRAMKRFVKMTEKDPRLKDADTTITLVFAVRVPKWHDRWRYFFVHAGDSRAYILSGGKLQQITEDDSPIYVLQEEKKMPDFKIKVHPRRNEIYSSFRQPPEPEELNDRMGIRNIRNYIESIIHTSFPFHAYLLDSADWPAMESILLFSDGKTDQTLEGQPWNELEKEVRAGLSPLEMVASAKLRETQQARSPSNQAEFLSKKDDITVIRIDLPGKRG